MRKEKRPIRVGQFSESPVLAVARAVGLDQKFGIDWETQRVPSSPAQFDSLSNGEIDIAITSPDNVLLYATTEANPLGKQLPLKFLRAIDRGLGLAMYTSAEVTDPKQLGGSTFGVDVPNSGFAFLLFAIAKKLGIEPSAYELESVGATPKRLEAVTSELVSATILNAETAVQAEAQGLRKWGSSADISDNYLGTVLAQLDNSGDEKTELFLRLWAEATEVILAAKPSELSSLLSVDFPKLSNENYIAFLQSSEFGLLRDPKVSLEQLQILADIRAQFSAYTPSTESIRRLMGS